MSDADRDRMLREMAENRGCRLVKSRRRTPGVGDYGRYGLTDKASGKEVFGFGKSGLTATADEIEKHLRDYMVADWKTSLKQAASAPKPEARPAPKRERQKAAPSPPPPPAPPPAPPPPPPPPKLVLREAKPKDAEAIASLIGALGFEASAGDVAKRLRALAKAGEPALIADRDGVVGCLTWHVTPVLHRPTPVGRVTMLVVAEAARRQGIGEALVAEAEARVAALGCALLEVTSNIELGGAHAFYRSLGFERTSYRFVKAVEPG